MELKLEEEKLLNIIQRHKLSKNMQFGSDADIYMTKRLEIQSTYIKCIQVSLATLYVPIICLKI